MPSKKKIKMENVPPVTPIVPSQQTIEGLAPDFKLIYTNYVQAGYTPLDVMLMVGETTGLNEGKVVVQHKARITMSPTEAKIVARILANTVKLFEKQFGEIVVPEGMMPQEER
jgi:hypothetical protein